MNQITKWIDLELGSLQARVLNKFQSDDDILESVVMMEYLKEVKEVIRN